MSEPRFAAVPIDERILAAVQAALERISPDNGFQAGPVAVRRPRRRGEAFPAVDWLIRLVQGPEEDDPAVESSGDGAVLSVPLLVYCDLIVRVPDGANDPADTYLNVFKADVRKALMADVQWGGLADNTTMLKAEYPIFRDGVEGVTVAVRIDFPMSEKDPYQPR